MRLIDLVVRRLPAPMHGNKVTYDSETKSFGCCVTAAGTRAFVLNYRREVDGREPASPSAASRVGARRQRGTKPGG
jgi:hypothetical protein